MHKGIILATLLTALFAGGIGVYFVLDQLSVRSFAATLRNTQTGEVMTCQAAFAPGLAQNRDPEIAVTTCSQVCGDKGFRQEIRSNAVRVVDYSSDEGYRRAVRRYWAYIPQRCRG